MTRTRWAVASFFLAYAAAVTWPGALPFNRIRPLVLGMPLSMAWVAAWLVLAFLALLLLDRAETREEDRRDRESAEEAERARRTAEGAGPPRPSGGAAAGGG